MRAQRAQQSRHRPSCRAGALRLVAASCLLAASIALLACGENEVEQPDPVAAPGEIVDLEPLEAAPLACEGARAEPGEADRTPIGFNDASFVEDWAPLEDALALHRAAGSTIIRYAVDWRLAEPAPGQLALERYDELYCEAIAAGVRPMIVLAGAPEWAVDTEISCPSGECLLPPRRDRLSELSRYARLIAERYPEAIGIEVWNEPNFFRFWGEPDAQRYTELLEAAHRGIRLGDPGIAVLGGSLTNSPDDDPSTGTVALRSFLETMYEHGADELMDGLALHPYPVHPLEDPGQQFDPALAVVRELAEGRSPSAGRIWVTEVGIPAEPGEPWAPAVSEEQQAATTLEMIARLEEAPDVEAIVFHSLLEPPGREGGFAWAEPSDDAGYRARPVFCAVAAARGAQGCAAEIVGEGQAP